MPGFEGFIVLAAALAGQPSPAEAPTLPVFGGEPVAEGEFESVVAVETPAGLCTGTLISDRLVLTAAHCVNEVTDIASVRVARGTDVRASGAVDLVVAEVGHHPCFGASCPGDGFDVGYVLLANPVDPPESFGYPAPFYDQYEYDGYVRVGASVVVVGYGQDPSGAMYVKRQVSIDITDFSASGREFDAGGDGADSCNGDSGGPAFIMLGDGTFRLLGLVSRGGDCGDGGRYVDPLPTLCWLENFTGEPIVPAACRYCTCVDLDPDRYPAGCGCASRSARPGPLREGLVFGVAVGGAWLGRRRRSGRSRRRS